MDQPDELKTTAEVAALLRTPENTVRYWRSVDVVPKRFDSPAASSTGVATSASSREAEQGSCCSAGRGP